MNDKIKSYFIKQNNSIRDAMRQMGQVGKKCLLVIAEGGQLLGSLSDGDIRRWVLTEGSLHENVEKIYNKKPIYVREDYSLDSVKELMLNNKIEWIPVLDQGNVVNDVLFWGNVFGKETMYPKERVSLPVIIMAGGKGTRLDPFTKILPKPLIPIGNKAIIELIMDKFALYGINDFYMSINHKSKMLMAYFEERGLSYKVHYIEEEKPLGTAGSLRYLKDQVEDDLIVSNCDIIIDCDYSEMVEFHKNNDYDITLAGSFRHFVIPYGVCKITEGGRLHEIQEKPEYDYLVNTGMYIMKKSVLNLIPENKFFNVTDLIERVMKTGGRVGVYPIDEKSWIDVGQWDEYRKTIRDLGG